MWPKFYMSYWENGSREDFKNKDKFEFILNCYKLSANLILKNYGEVHLLTDTNSEKYFKNIGYTTITNIFDNFQISKEYSHIWSLGKIFAYKYLSENEIPFIHVDNDVFLWKHIPNRIICANLIAQSKEEGIYNEYKLNNFYKNCNKKYIAGLIKTNYAPNVGIFGGKNIDFLYRYSSSALDMALDKRNKDYWTKIELGPSWRKAVCIEQYYLATCIEYFGEKIEYLSGEDNSLDALKCSDLGYTHLLAAKKGEYIEDKIKFILKVMNF